MRNTSGAASSGSAQCELPRRQTILQCTTSSSTYGFRKTLHGRSRPLKQTWHSEQE